jgi:hypothetical protein
MKERLRQSNRACSNAGLAPLLLLGVIFCFWPPTAAAQKRQSSPVVDTILGIHIGASRAEARAILDPLKMADDRDAVKDGREAKRGGIKEAWSLRGTAFATVALKTNEKGRVVWITGFVRPGQDIPFSQLGPLSRAASANESVAIWNVETQAGGYRLVAKGQGGKARVVYLLSLAVPPIE